MKKISIVIPAFNEEENLPQIRQAVDEVFITLSEYNYEIIFVNDGSRDNTQTVLEDLSQKFPKVKFIEFSRNFGHQNAVKAGLDFADGNCVISMDGDMQHPPEEIPNMLAAHQAGAEVVYMQRTNMTDNVKGVLGKSFYRLFNLVSDTPLVPDAADFRLLSRKVIDVLLRMPGHGKLLRAIIPTISRRQVTLQYIEEKRQYGTASYSYSDLFTLVLHAVFKFSRFPAYFTTVLGLLFVFSGIIGILLIETGLLDDGPHTFALLIALILAGCIFFCAGILCFYLYFLLEQVRQVPRYIVDKTSLNTTPE